MKPENRDPYFMSPAAEVGKKQTQRDIGVPYLPMDGDGVNEIAEPISGNVKLKKALKIAGIIVLVALFIGLGVVVLSDLSSDMFRINPPIG